MRKFVLYFAVFLACVVSVYPFAVSAYTGSSDDFNDFEILSLEDYITDVTVNGTTQTITVDLSGLPYTILVREYGADTPIYRYEVAAGETLPLDYDLSENAHYYIWVGLFYTPDARFGDTASDYGAEYPKRVLDLGGLPDGTSFSGSFSISGASNSTNLGNEVFNIWQINNVPPDLLFTGVSYDYSYVKENGVYYQGFSAQFERDIGRYLTFSTAINPYELWPDKEYYISPGSTQLIFTYDQMEQIISTQGEMNATLKAILAQAIETNNSLDEILSLLQGISDKLDSIGGCDHSTVEDLLQQILYKQDQLTPTPDQSDKAEQMEDAIGDAAGKLEDNNSILEQLTPSRPQLSTDLQLDEENLLAVSPLVTNIWSINGVGHMIGIVLMVATVAYIFFGKRDG